MFGRMERLRQQIGKFAVDESGATAIEYCLIASLISIMIVAGATSIGVSVKAKFQSVANGLQ